MIEKTATPERPPEPKASPSDDKPAITPDTLSLALASNPRFKVLPRSGAGFVIGGEKPQAR
jgi:hypothetical protein